MVDEGAVVTPEEFWNSRYGEKDQIWSGRVNKVLEQVVAGFTPGKSLDLGSGEGGDVLWLASKGWDALGIDISTTAVKRAKAAAEEANLDNARFVAADLAELDKDANFDLVTATFFHSPVELEREKILNNAAALVAPGGHLLVISHATPPPWAQHVDHMKQSLKAPEEELASLGLNEEEWPTVLLETRTREATGPDGQTGTLEDGVILLRRNAN